MWSSLSCRLPILLAVLASLTHLAASADNPLTAPVDCPSSSTNSSTTFRSNVAALLDALPTAVSPAGFASLSRGDGADRAFVRGICRGDVTPSDCAAYLGGAAYGLFARCNSTRRAAIWYGSCLVSYGDTNASTGHEDAYRAVFYNVGVVANKDAFEQTYYALMRRLAARVVANADGLMLATGEAVFDRAAAPGSGIMYGMLQCMRDRVSPAECDRCLRASVRELPTCCYGRQGGVVLGYNCWLRVETYSYYDLALDGPPPPSDVPPPPEKFIGQRREQLATTTLAVPLPVGMVLLSVAIIVAVLLYRRKANDRQEKPPDNSSKEEDTRYVEPEQLNLRALRAATNNFSEENKLGEGGFGEVFKGTLENGKQIAVKRLSQRSKQGFHELKNELVLAAKLKHRNVVQILGVCLQEEKLIVYEYMPNRSLDTFLFDPVRRQQLDWSKRYSIICGIARGLLYLHEESRLKKVIHRDLKPSNVLLDADMNPKISDFGLARAFAGDESRNITTRPVGTLGYMSPEYAYNGHVSTKSDMFSFGVIVLEMVTGRSNSSAYDGTGSISLLSYVWSKWQTGSRAELVDPSLAASGCPESQVLRCLELGLLCVQKEPADRPDASTVVLMLSSSTYTTDDYMERPPSRPAFVFTTASDRLTAAGARSSSGTPIVGDKRRSAGTNSNNEMSISELQPR